MVPARGAATGISIFIDSISIKVSSKATDCPIAVSIFHTFPATSV